MLIKFLFNYKKNKYTRFFSHLEIPSSMKDFSFNLVSKSDTIKYKIPLKTFFQVWTDDDHICNIMLNILHDLKLSKDKLYIDGSYRLVSKSPGDIIYIAYAIFDDLKEQNSKIKVQGCKGIILVVNYHENMVQSTLESLIKEVKERETFPTNFY